MARSSLPPARGPIRAGARWAGLGAALACLASACAAPQAAPPAPEGAAESEWATTLAGLADDALARGDLARAQARFRRVLARDPRSASAHVGLGRIALRRNDVPAARMHFEAATAADPQRVGAWLGRADLARIAEDPDSQRTFLDRALAIDPWLASAHARRFRLTGRAPRAARQDPLALADAHPYEPRARLRAGEALLAAGDRAAAREHFERALWLADLDPDAARDAAERLRAVDERWRTRRLVPVHVFADELVAAEEGWRFRLRTVWHHLSLMTADVLDVWFVPASLRSFAGAGVSDDLESIHAAFARAARPAPRRGILAAFTGREPPALPGAHKRGLADFGGRRLTVRLEPGERESRVLAHEILHLYGAVHVVDDVESLMNPSGDTLRLDPANARIVRALERREFSDRGSEHDIGARVDLPAAISAYQGALRVNLHFRQQGAAEVLEMLAVSRYQAAAKAREVAALDPHLADVCRMVADLMLADGRAAEALGLLDLAVDLYGPRTRRGRATHALSESLRGALVERYGVSSPTGTRGSR